VGCPNEQYAISAKRFGLAVDDARAAASGRRARIRRAATDAALRIRGGRQAAGGRHARHHRRAPAPAHDQYGLKAG